MTRLSWEPIVDDAAAWVRSLDITPTLRQVFYHLVATQVIPNSRAAYTTLSARTAEARRDGWFPRIADGTRSIWQPQSYDDLMDLSVTAARSFRLDRWAVQDTLVVIAVEKRGMLSQFASWFGDFGFPIVPVAGYGSQTIYDDLSSLVARDGRDAVLLYGGDFDASGLDITRDMVLRTDCWSEVQRVALTAAQVDRYDLPVNPAKATDSRTAKFAAANGYVQVEVDALDPDDLRDLFARALLPFVDMDAHREVKAREAALRAEFAAMTGVTL